jgi:hypothetical protein
LEDLLAEKEDQLSQIRTQSTNSIESTDSAISAMEESITEKERQIERYFLVQHYNHLHKLKLSCKTPSVCCLGFNCLTQKVLKTENSL